MSNFRNIGYISLVVVVFMELGSIFVNISEVFSAFYLFDISQRFSTDNNLFLLYWGAALGCVFLIRDFDSSLVPSIDKIINADETTNSNVSTSSKKPRDKRPNTPDMPDKHNLELKLFLSEKNISYLECKHKWNSYWGHIYAKWLKGK